MLLRPEIEVAGVGCKLLIDQIRTVDTDDIGDPIGYLTHDEMAQVETVIAHYFGIAATWSHN